MHFYEGIIINENKSASAEGATPQNIEFSHILRVNQYKCIYLCKLYFSSFILLENLDLKMQLPIENFTGHGGCGEYHLHHTPEYITEIELSTLK